MDITEQNSHTLIMVVDDNLEFLNGIQLSLEMEGFQVWTATNGQDALDQLRAAFLGQNQDSTKFVRLPDLILADIMMPVMDGYAFYQQVRDNPHLHDIPFIFLTAKSSDTDIRLGKELGPDDYLTKPCPPDDVLATIKGKLKRAEQRRFFDLMSKRAEERQQDLDNQITTESLQNRQVVVFAAIAIIIIFVVIALVFFPQ